MQLAELRKGVIDGGMTVSTGGTLPPSEIRSRQGRAILDELSRRDLEESVRKTEEWLRQELERSHREGTDGSEVDSLTMMAIAEVS